jgi:alpha-mannosidase
VIETVKGADDDPGAIVVRMYEAWGRRGPVTLRTPWEIRRAILTDLLEREIAPLPTSGATVTLEMAPFQIVTVKLDVAPG